MLFDSNFAPTERIFFLGVDCHLPNLHQSPDSTCLKHFLELAALIISYYIILKISICAIQNTITHEPFVHSLKNTKFSGLEATSP